MEYISGNIYIREMALEKAGDIVNGHTHNFDHTTYVVRGSVLVESLNEDGTVKQSAIKRAQDGQNWVLIKAEVKHRITALEDNCMAHCVYAHRIPMGLTSDHGGITDVAPEIDAEYDALLERLMALCELKFGNIVQHYDGWSEAYQ